MAPRLAAGAQDATASTTTPAADTAATTTPTAAPAVQPPPGVRYLVNPSGVIVEFMDGPVFEEWLFKQRPPTVKNPKDWFREPTDEELQAYLAKK